MNLQWLALLLGVLLSACAMRPVNPPIVQTDPGAGYRFELRQAALKDRDTLVILAFSGGGTRAAEKARIMGGNMERIMKGRKG